VWDESGRSVEMAHYSLIGARLIVAVVNKQDGQAPNSMNIRRDPQATFACDDVPSR
jgi:hypothetical protein